MRALEQWLRHERLFRAIENRAYDSPSLALSGWDSPSPVTDTPDTELTIPAELVRRYQYIDELPNPKLDGIRETFARYASFRERTAVDAARIVVTPGATAAIAVLMHHFVDLGYRNIIADTPLYFSYYRVAAALRMTLDAARRTTATLESAEPLLELLAEPDRPKAVVILANPKYVLSRPYDDRAIAQICASLRSDDVLFLDESLDTGHATSASFDHRAVYKVKTIGKTLGYNGSRASLIVAPAAAITDILRVCGWMFGALDAGMLALAASLVSDLDLYAQRLCSLRSNVQNRYEDHRRVLSSPRLKLLQPENGFLGAMLVDLSKIGRWRWYRWLLKHRVHAMGGVHFGISPESDSDVVRVNHLLEITPALAAIDRYFADADRDVR